MRENPKEYQIYRHFRGTYYQVLAVAKHTETEEMLVVYRSLYEPEKVFARPLEMFMGEVSQKPYPDTQKRYRFELVTGKETEQQVKNSAVKVCEEDVSEKSETKLKTKLTEKIISDSIYEDYDDFVIDAELEKFLDEKSYEKKLERLVYLKNKADDEMLNTIAMSLDLELSKTSTEEKYAEILDCLKTLEKYECNRLR